MPCYKILSLMKNFCNYPCTDLVTRLYITWGVSQYSGMSAKSLSSHRLSRHCLFFLTSCLPQLSASLVSGCLHLMKNVPHSDLRTERSGLAAGLLEPMTSLFWLSWFESDASMNSNYRNKEFLTWS